MKSFALSATVLALGAVLASDARGASATEAPPNDSVTAARVFSALPFETEADTAGATTSPGDETTCAHSRNTVWYRFAAPADGIVEVRTVGSSYDTTLAVVHGPARLVCNDDADGRHAAVRWSARAGGRYDVQVAGHKGQAGRLKLAARWVTGAPAPDPLFASEPSAAVIRPGVQIDLPGATCTANFVFVGRGVLEGRAYIGTAGHCAADLDIGQEARLLRDANGHLVHERIGTVAYSSFKQMVWTAEPCLGPVQCVHPRRVFDAALIELDPGVVDRTSPSTLTFGGPTGVAPRAEMAVGDRLLTYGNQPLLDARWLATTDNRPLLSAFVPRWEAGEGYLLNPGVEDGHAAAWFVPHRIPGDSGSPVLAADGRAAGIVATIQGVIQDGVPGANGFTLVETALRLAAAEGFVVEIVTAPMLSRGLLPDVGEGPQSDL